MQPLLIDLYCGAGIGADGYASYFDILGVDKYHQPRNPHPFIQMDALNFLRKLIAADGEWEGRPVAAVHASPPCQEYSNLKFISGIRHPKLIDETRALIDMLDIPYAIENVEYAPLHSPILLCGTMFPGLRVIRHRVFESNIKLEQPEHISPKEHPLVFTLDRRRLHYGKLAEWDSFVSVTGGGNCTFDNAVAAMGVSPERRVSQRELVTAIPPAYTDFVGSQLVRFCA